MPNNFILKQKGDKMKKIVISLLVCTTMVLAGGFVQSGVAPGYIVGSDTLFGGLPYDACRGITSGSDLDQDGKLEVFVTSYTEGGRIFGFEEAGTDTFAFVWASPELLNSDGSATSYPRDVHTGDMDGDGLGEIIFHVGRYPTNNTDNGIYVYEWDGTIDDGYGTAPGLFGNLYSALNDSLNESRVEGFSVGDIDGDGKDEIILSNNGGSNPTYKTVDGSTPYSEDRFIILGATSVGGFGASFVEEFAVSPRDVNKDGVRENALGGGSPQDAVICDIDGDGNLEAACFSWNNLAVFFIEATGTDSYTIGDTAIGTPLVDESKSPYLKLANNDDWTLGAAVADMDGDGKDEVYITGYYDDEIYVITDSDDDATTLDTTGWTTRDWVGNSEVAIIGNSQHGLAAVAGFGVFAGSIAGVSDIEMWTLATGGNPLAITDWTHTVFGLEDATSGTILKYNAGIDFDEDGNLEVVIPYKGLADSTAGALDPNQNRAFRIAEWDPNLVATVKDVIFIMPNDYKLAQNYPNPFNPITTIEYSLPLDKAISLTIYNIKGQVVKTLVNNEFKTRGDHSVQWNGMNDNSIKVSSGIYFYTLKYGNFSKTKQMTFLK